MTVLAFKEGVLAADRLGIRAGVKGLAKKIHRVQDGWIAGAGSTATILEMVNWYRAGADPRELPAKQRSDENDQLILLTAHGLFVFEQGPFPVSVVTPTLALGSGSDYAATAMHLGKSAIEAVEIAGELSATCGGGVDWVTMDSWVQ